MKQLKQVCFILLLFAGRLSAAPIVSGNSGNWNNPATWVGGVVPSAGDNVTIANGHTVTVTANAACASLLIGNGLLNQSTTLTFSPGIALAVTGNVNISAPLSGTTDNTLDVNDGTVSCVSLITSNAANNLQRCIISINNGTLTCSFNFLMAGNTDRNKLMFTGSGILQLGRNNNTIADAQFTPATGTIEYNSTIVAQNILPLSYYSLKCSGTTSKNLIANTILTGDLLIAGSAQLDAGNTGNYSLTVAGNWTVTSTNINPFIERKGTVTFNGTSGIQAINTPLVQESFYNLVISNTAGNAAADIVFNKTCYVSQAITYTSGITDLKGNRLNVVSQNNTNSFVTCNLSGGRIISSVAGAQVSFTDNLDSTLVNFTGTSVGNSTIAVPLTINTGRINIENLTLYGTGSFTKTLHYDDVVAKGGNKYYGAVNFTATANCGNWYSGAGNGALPDSFFAKADFYSFINDAAARFILGANSLGNYYADSVSINNRSAGTFLIGNSSGAANGTSSSHFFNKLTDVLVAGSGDIVFAEAQSLLPSSVTFNSKIRIGSAATGTGNIYIGKNTAGSSISLSNTGQLITGNIYGNTGVYFYNVVQTGSLAQVLTNQTTQTSKIIVGSLLSPCTWNGPLTFKASVLDLAYSNFNSTCYFTLNNSSSTQTYTGGNHFATGTTTGFTNTGTADWQIAVTSADDYNGDVLYQVNSGGAIYPAYNTNCTYAGSIVILPSSDSVIFAAAANGRVTLDGNASGYFTNNSVKPSSIKRITMNKTAGLFTLYRNIFMPPGGDLSLVSGKLVTSGTAMLILQDESCTVTANTSAAGSYVDGPLRIDVSSTAIQTLHFPVGKGIESRPVDLTIQHTSNTSYSYTVETVSASANALGWSNPASVSSVSTIRWWDITRTVTSSGTAAPLTDLVTSPLPVVAFYYGLNDRANIPANLTICKNTYNALTTWIDIGASGATNAIGKVTSTSTPGAFNSFSRFTLGYYGIPLPPVANDSSRCGTGSVTISATPIQGEAIDWYAAPSGGVALATGSNTFTTPSVAVTTTYYAQARNTRGYISATRTAVKAIIYNTASITSFSPTVGEIGTSVIITGSNFTNVTGVSFGGTPAASYTVNSVTQITAVVAAGSSGAVSVNNNCGPATKAGFIYLPTTVWTGAVSNAWTLAGNWDDGVPTNIHCAIIPNVTTLPLISSNQAVKSITVQSGANIDIAAGNSLSVRDSITNNGSITGGGTVLLDGTSSQPMSGTGTYNNLSLNNSAGAIIKSGAGNMVNITGTYTPIAGVLTSNTNFTLKSNATATGIITSGAAAGGYINGKITLERFVPAKRAWRLINFPVTAAAVPNINTALQEGAGGNASLNPNPGYGTHITGGTVAAGFDQNTNNSASMKEWDGTAWQGIASTNLPISNSLPYFLFVRGSRANNLALGTGAIADNTVLRLTANVKQGNQSIPVSGTGWQLTGNPFPSIINLDAVATSNSTVINRNFIYWDPKLGGSNNVGGFVTASYNGFDYDFTPAPSSQLSEYAQPFSGFYVDAVATGSISVTESTKCNCGYGNVFRPAPSVNSNSKLHIDLRSVNADGTTPVVDGVMAAFSDRYSNSIDRYDAKKLFNNLAENISITSNNSNVSVERRKAIGYADTLFLDVRNMKARNYQFEIRPESFDSRSATAYLEDSYTAERKALDLGTVNLVDFTIVNIPGSYARDRFRIVFEKEMVPVITGKMSAASGNTGKGDIRLLQNPVTGNQLKLEFKGMAKGSYLLTILDKEGKEIARKNLDHNGIDAVKMISIKNYLPAGIQVANIKGTSGNSISFNILVQ